MNYICQECGESCDGILIKEPFVDHAYGATQTFYEIVESYSECCGAEIEESYGIIGRQE